MIIRHDDLGKVVTIRPDGLGKVVTIRPDGLGKVVTIRPDGLGKAFIIRPDGLGGLASNPTTSEAGHPLASLLLGGTVDLLQARIHQVVQAVPQRRLSCLRPKEYRVENLSPAMGRGIDSRKRVWN